MPGHSTDLQRAINNTNDRIDNVEDDIERVETDLTDVLIILRRNKRITAGLIKKNNRLRIARAASKRVRGRLYRTIIEGI